MGRKQDFETCLTNFFEFMSAQDKITTFNDVINGLLYTFVTSPDNLRHALVILGYGIRDPYLEVCNINMIPKNCDLQLNIEIGVHDNIQTKIYFHKTGTPLWDRENWIEERKEEDDE